MDRKPFEGILGDTLELEILDFLLPLEGIDFNILEIADEVRIAESTAQLIIDKFLEYNILHITKKENGILYYTLNTKSPFVILMNELNNLLIERMGE